MIGEGECLRGKKDECLKMKINDLILKIWDNYYNGRMPNTFIKTGLKDSLLMS